MDDLYSIQVISRLTGIDAHTIRTWEKRYKCVSPKRQKNGRRVYNDNELQKLQLLKQVCQMGESIGNIAHLDLEDLQTISKKIMPGNNFESNHVISIKPDERNIKGAQETLSKIQIALESYRLDIISYEIHKLKVLISPRDFALSVIGPLMRNIGLKVQEGTLDIAQEHAISSILRFHIGSMIYGAYEKKYRSDKKIALATASGELHEFGLLLTALLCCHHNIPFYYLGANLPANSFVQASQALEADILILGTTKNKNNEILNSYIEYILNQLLPNQQLWLGGEGAFNLPKYSKNSHFHFISNLEHLDSYLLELKGKM